MANPTTFDPAEFVRDFNEAGCKIELMQVDAHGLMGFAIKSGKGYGATMKRWADVLDDTPDFQQQVVAFLQGGIDHG